MESATNAIPPPTAVACSPADPPPPDAVMPFPLPAGSALDQAKDGVADVQAQLRYLLSVSTNEPGTKVIMPEFAPPEPPLAYPASHAAYESR